MKALLIRQFGEPASHHVESLPRPTVGPGEVLIQVAAAGINFPDTLVVTGKYQILPPLPFIPGKDAAGTILETGEGVTQLQPGDRVIAQMEYGGYATHVVTSAENCYKLPCTISEVDAAAMGLVYQTAYFALTERAGFQAGERVLVNGAAGGVGSAAIQLVKAFGGIALAGVNTPEQADVARRHGADHIIDLAVDDLRNGLRDQVFKVTNGHGADVILDTLGDEVFAASLRALAWCGRLVVIGFAAGAIPTMKVNYLLLKNIAVSGLQWSDYRDRKPELVREVQSNLFALHAAGKIKPEIAQILALHESAIGLNALASGKARGKYVLEINT